MIPNKKLENVIKAGPSKNQIVNIILSRMVDKKKEYVINLDYKWMSLDMMSIVYSTIPEITPP